jgi:hypothetical protein
MLQYTFIVHCSKLVPPIMKLNTAMSARRVSNRFSCSWEVQSSDMLLTTEG